MNPNNDTHTTGTAGPAAQKVAATATKQMKLEPMSGSGFLSVIEAVLRKPGSLVHHFCNESPTKVMICLLVSTVVNLSIFGLVVGSFSMGDQLWAAPLKIISGFLFASLICLPSLFIFANLSGLPVKISMTVGLLAVMQSLCALLLVGFAPVIWIFSQSTESLLFVGILNVLIWMISLGFGLSLIGQACRALGAKSSGHLQLWMVIFVLVIFQVGTTLRPILGSSDSFYTDEKKSFVQHWYEAAFEGDDIQLRR